ncbi:MAG: hypothetical protein H6707_12370 [Deltaproteobacteria bacterium]|nr:hypothetical protein [Deltaproteobacteria bacterium]
MNYGPIALKLAFIATTVAACDRAAAPSIDAQGDGQAQDAVVFDLGVDVVTQDGSAAVRCGDRTCLRQQQCCALITQCYYPYEFLCGTGDCGGPCADGLNCLGCRSGESGHHSLCTTGCRSDADCLDPARPRCNQPQPDQPGLCTPKAFGCCWFCI